MTTAQPNIVCGDTDASSVHRTARDDPAPDILVGRTLAGDLEAFGCLYDQYVRLVHAVCFDMTADHMLAEDLVHETFLHALRNLNQLRRRDRFGPWLMGINYRVTKEWQRRKTRDRHRFIGLNVNSEAQTETSDAGHLDQLRISIARLPRIERLALHFFYLQEQPAEHARAMLGLSRSGFYRVLQRARNRLRRWASISEASCHE